VPCVAWGRNPRSNARDKSPTQIIANLLPYLIHNNHLITCTEERKIRKVLVITEQLRHFVQNI